MFAQKKARADGAVVPSTKRNSGALICPSQPAAAAHKSERLTAGHRPRGSVRALAPCAPSLLSLPGHHQPLLTHTPSPLPSSAFLQGAQFPLFSKIEVNGENTHEVYRYLKRSLPGEIVRARTERKSTEHALAPENGPFVSASLLSVSLPEASAHIQLRSASHSATRSLRCPRPPLLPRACSELELQQGATRITHPSILPRSRSTLATCAAAALLTATLCYPRRLSACLPP